MKDEKCQVKMPDAEKVRPSFANLQVGKGGLPPPERQRRDCVTRDSILG